MSGNKQSESEEQLLQDASTLLMFANVAAKQQQEINKLSPSPPPGSQPPSQIHSATQSQASSQGQSPHQRPIEAHMPVLNHQVKHTVFDPVRQIYINSPNLQPSQPNIQPIQSIQPIQPVQPIQPSNKPYLPSVFQPLGYSQSAVNVVQQQSPPTLPTPLAQPQIFANGHSHPILPSANPTPYQLNPKPILPQTHLTTQTSAQNAPVPIRPAVSRTVSKTEITEPVVPKEQKTPVTMHATPNSAPLPASSDNIPEKGHKRTSSIPSTAKYNHALSPGPASVVLSRGIDSETGKPNNSNAIIAAAALAQAADNPLPLLKREEAIKLQLKKEEEEKEEESKSKPLHEPVESNTVVAVKEEKPATKPVYIPPLEEYQVEPDSGVIGCICGIPDDDGFTIQCDICHRWQHCLCMDYKTNEEVPEEEEEYQCYFCDKTKWGKFDAEKCRKDTITRLKQNNDNDDNDNDSKTNKRKVLGSGRAEDKKKRRLENEKNKERRKQLRDDFDGTDAQEELPAFVPSKDNELFEDNTAENYQSTYYKLRANDYRNHEYQRYFEKLGKDFYDLYQQLPQEEKNKTDIKVVPLKDFKAISRMYVKTPNHEKYLLENDSSFKVPNTFVQVKAYSDSQKQKFNGISKLSLFIQANTDDRPDTFEEVIPKGTPILDYFGVLDLFTNYRDNKTNQYHIWGTTKPKVLKESLGLISDDKSILKTDVILDSRFVGNETRFIRKACPLAVNCEIQKYYVPETSSFKFMVVTSKDITLNNDVPEEELRLLWEWDENHPILKLNTDEAKNIEGLKVDQLPKKERTMLMNTIDNILYFTECGCSTSSSSPLYVPNCSVFKVKKAMTYMLRSTRKISGIMSANAHRAKEELMTTKGPEPFISWEQRLEERDHVIQGKLYFTSNEDSTSDNLTEEIKQETLRQTILNQKVKQLNDTPITKMTLEEVKEDVLDLFALSPKITEKIEKSVQEEVTIKPEIKRSISEIKLKIKDDNLEKISKVLNIEVEKPPVTVEVEKPAVKKKLSFADYKKKMK